MDLGSDRCNYRGRNASASNKNKSKLSRFLLYASSPPSYCSCPDSSPIRLAVKQKLQPHTCWWNTYIDSSATLPVLQNVILSALLHFIYSVFYRVVDARIRMQERYRIETRLQTCSYVNPIIWDMHVSPQREPQRQLNSTIQRAKRFDVQASDPVDVSLRWNTIFSTQK